MTRLVVLCDGTWSGPRWRRRGSSPTNVAKLGTGVADRDADGRPQLVHHQPGVGTARLERFLGGAFGFGLSRNLRESYRFVVDAYEPGDVLYVAGFSRGAFTARSLVGLIRNAGILRPEHRDRVDEAYRLYRAVGERRHPDGPAASCFRARYAHPDPGGPLVHFVGVWDTVGALGIPGAPARLVRGRWSFHDTTLSRRVQNAFHAVAIDEGRRLYRPTLWDRHDPGPGQRVEQVWFAGVHGDVGGGYADPELAEIPLLWIAERAQECGLRLRPGHLRRVPGLPACDPDRTAGRATDADPLGPAHDSSTGIHRLLPRTVRALADPGGTRGLALASSAVVRDATTGYALPADAAGLPVVDVPSAPRASGP